MDFKRITVSNIFSFIIGIILVFTTYALGEPNAKLSYVDKQNEKQDERIETIRIEIREDNKYILEQLIEINKKLPNEEI